MDERFTFEHVPTVFTVNSDVYGACIHCFARSVTQRNELYERIIVYSMIHWRGKYTVRICDEILNVLN